MNTRKKTAIQTFRSGHNCAQSVLMAYAGELNTDQATVLRMASGFGAGMGRLQKTCGALTGAFMTAGLICTQRTEDMKKAKEETIRMIQAIHKGFEEIHGTTECEALIKCDLKTDDGQDYFSEQRLSENVCEKCILTAVDLLGKTS